MTSSHPWLGPICVALFALAYALVAFEERSGLRKSVPVMLGAGLIWILIGIAYAAAGRGAVAAEALRHTLLEFAELFLFLLSAVTFVNTLEDRRVFAALRSWLLRRGLTLRGLFWATGAMAFLISPVADNLTTALVVGAVLLAVGERNPRFVAPACINVVVAANAGGAFSPFGDITTLMVWQSGHVGFFDFARLLAPALVDWLVPAAILTFAVPRGRPAAEAAATRMIPGARAVIALFVLTLLGTVALRQLAGLPPVLGMMTGLAALKLYSHALEWSRRDGRRAREVGGVLAEVSADDLAATRLDVFGIMQRIEWDTLMFFYGVMLAVGGLGLLGHLAALSHALYDRLGATAANVVLGLLSALVDNIPVTYAVLQMNPDMPQAQWLLATLAVGVGGSLLSVGSAAGVALMGQARGIYTFMAHLRWSWAIAAGYAASVAVHLLVNGR